MKNIASLLLFLYTGIGIAQPKLELTPNGFPAIEINIPAKPLQNLMDASRSWADAYNKEGADVYDVTSNSLKIDALNSNAFFYRNVGETYTFKIRYTLSIDFGEKRYRLSFRIKEIFDSNEKQLDITLADYFTSEGKLKEDFDQVKPSLENTANAIVRSFSSYIAQ